MSLIRINILLLISVLLATSVRAAEGECPQRVVTVFNPGGGVFLAGTLSTPTRGVPTRGVIVMATGSGPQDRDETILGYKPFRMLADSLAAAGWASLRLDDRGTGESTGEFATATIEDFVSDNAAAVAWADSAYNGLPIGILGHSEGGSIAIINARRPEVDFIITLGAPAWRGDSIVMSQARALAVGTTGRWDKEGLQRSLLDIAGGKLPARYARPMITELLKNDLGVTNLPPEAERQLRQAVDGLLTPWYRSMLRYDPGDDIAAVTIPWLALSGDKDTQVLPGNLATIRALNPSATTILLPGLNHLFQNASTGLVTEYATSGQPMTRAVTDAILDFLSKNELYWQ